MTSTKIIILNVKFFYSRKKGTKLYKTVTLGGFTVRAIKQMFDDYMNNLDAFTQVVEENPGRTAAWYRKQLKKRGVWVEED